MSAGKLEGNTEGIAAVVATVASEELAAPVAQ